MVDVLAEEIEKEEKNYAEIGGEIRVKGKNLMVKHGALASINRLKTHAETRVIQEVIHLENRSMPPLAPTASFTKKWVKYSHTIDPKTGYPVSHTLLSAT